MADLPLLQDPSQEISTGEPSLPERVFGGLLVGARRDPILGLAIDRIVKELPGIDPEHLDAFATRLEGSSIADVAGLVGEYGPSFAAGAGTFTLGRIAMVKALQAAAPRLAAVAGGGRLGSQLGRVAAKAEDVAGATKLITKPGLQRGVETAGGALGIGSFTGAEQLAETGDVHEALKGFALGAVLAAGAEATLIGGGKLLARRAREVDPQKQLEAFAALEPLVGAEVADATRRVGQLRRQLFKLNDQATQEREIIEAQRGLLTGLRLGDEPLFSTAKAGTKPGRLGKLGSAAKLTKRRIRQTQTKISGLRQAVRPEEIILTDITRPGAIDPSAVGVELQKLWMRVLQRPEASAQKLGLPMIRFMQHVDNAEIEVFLSQHVNEALVLKAVRGLEAAIGVRPSKSLTVADEKLAPLFRAFEEKGTDGVRAEFGENAAGLVSRLQDDLARVYAPVERIGGEAALTSEELAGMGLTSYFPQVLSDIPEKDVLQRLVKYFMRSPKQGGLGLTEPQAFKRANRIVERRTQDGIRRFGSIDHQRLIPGSLAAKLEAGLPFEGPATGLLRYLNELSRRVAYGSRFGYRGELKDTYITLATAGGASRPLVNTLADHFLTRKYHSHALRRLGQSITSLQTGVKLPFAGVANASQFVNDMIGISAKNTVRAARTSLTREGRKTGGKLAGLQEQEFDAVRRVHSGVQGDNLFDRFARWSMGFFQFNRTEQFNRLRGAVTTLYTIHDDLAKGFAGRLRGNRLDGTRRRFGQLGLNFDRIIREGRRTVTRGGTIEDAVRVAHGPQAFDQAVVRGARLTQFIPFTTRVPLAWQHPMGRMLTQFKTFALNQGIFLRDQVLAEAARGNMRPLATFLAVYPIAGEVVSDSLAVIKGRDREEDGIWRLVDDIAAIGGFGVAQAAVTNAQFGRLEETFLGPSISDFTSIAEAVLRFDTAGAVRTLRRQPLVQATERLVIGAAIGIDALIEYAELDSDEAQPEASFATLEQLREQAARDK